MADLDAKTREKLKRFYIIYSDIFEARKLEVTEVDASTEAYELALTALPLSADELKEFKKAMAMYSVNGPPFMEQD